MKVSTKKLIFAAVSLFTCNAINAQVGPTIPDVTIAPGGTTTVSVELNDEVITTYISCSFTLAVPEGFTIDINSGKVTDRTDDHAISIKEGTSGYKMTLNTSSNAYLSGTSGALFTFDLACAETVAEGNYKFTMTNANASYRDPETNKPAKVRPETATFNITVAAPTTETITLDNEWNTYCSANNLDFSSVTDAEFYVVSSVTSTSAKLAPVTSLPAGQGFLIKGTAGSSITVNIATSDVTAPTNVLKGTTAVSPLDPGNFILYEGKFVPCKGGSIAANKAYLPAGSVPTEAKTFALDFGGTTGINEVQTTKADSAIYNLNGMRVSKTQKGVYIMNGRKVIVK
jgi:hypothetical protein